MFFSNAFLFLKIRKVTVYIKYGYKTIFFGNDLFSLPHLEALRASNATSSLNVVTSSEQSKVSEYCRETALPYKLWSCLEENESEFFLDHDVGILASFGKMIPEWMIGRFRHGIINVHPSLLPRWRGSSPIIYSILHGDEVVGVTLLTTEAGKFDRGRVLSQREVRIDAARTTRPQLTAQLAFVGAGMVVQMMLGRDVARAVEEARPQLVTEAVKVARRLQGDQLARVDWSHQTGLQVDRLHRALMGLFPLRCSAARIGDVRLGGLLPTWAIPTDVRSKLEATPGATRPVPGDVRFIVSLDSHHFYVRCLDDWIGFSRITIGRSSQKRRQLTALQFNNGYLAASSSSPHSPASFRLLAAVC